MDAEIQIDYLEIFSVRLMKRIDKNHRKLIETKPK